MRWREAIALGLESYLPDKPCTRGHWSIRKTSNPTCPECKASLSRTWKRANADKVKVSRKKCHVRRREKDLELNRLWYQRNKNKHRENNKRWADENRDLTRSYTAKSYRKNIGKNLNRAHKRYHEDPEKNRARVRKYRCEKAVAAQALAELGIEAAPSVARLALKEMGVEI